MTTDLMEVVDDAQALGWTRLFQGVGVVAEKFLVDAGDSADCCHGGIKLGAAQECSGVEFIIQLIIARYNVVGESIAICNAILDMPSQGFLKIGFQLRQSFGSDSNCAANILA